MNTRTLTDSTDRPPPVVFLDIDDVVCLNSTFGCFAAVEAVQGRHPNPPAVYRSLFASTAIATLRRIYDAMGGGLRFVITSTWREALSRQQMADLFQRSGLAFVAENLHEGEPWRTTVKLGRARRVDEIAAWLDRYHRGEPFVIIDDKLSGASLLPAISLPNHPFAQRLVLCQEGLGLVNSHAQALIDALRRPAPAPGDCR